MTRHFLHLFYTTTVKGSMPASPRKSESLPQTDKVFMSKLVFRLRNVPEDEAQDVREILENNDIGYFETSAGNWGISLPAIWINETEEFEQARQLIDEYQLERTERLRREYQAKRLRAKQKHFGIASRKARKVRSLYHTNRAVLYVWAQAFVFF